MECPSQCTSHSPLHGPKPVIALAAIAVPAIHFGVPASDFAVPASDFAVPVGHCLFGNVVYR